MLGLGLGIAVVRGAGVPGVPAPANTVAPVISGTPSVGSVLNTTNGTWTGSPTGYTYQWRANGVAIVGATASSYTVVLADDGKNITCAVTATNAGGSTSAVSNSVGPVTSGPTYDDFVAHITGLSGGVNTWGASVGGSGTRITTAAAATGAMYGTPWNSWSAENAITCRVIQHALPSEAEFNAQIAAGRSILMQMVSVGNQLFSGINRNGYTSLSDGTEGADAANCTQILFWSGTDTGGSAFSMNPSTGTGPTPYTW